MEAVETITHRLIFYNENKSFIDQNTYIGRLGEEVAYFNFVKIGDTIYEVLSIGIMFDFEDNMMVRSYIVRPITNDEELPDNIKFVKDDDER